jgi:hypothetical protein
MLGTVRTSIGNRSAEGLGGPSFEGERERFEEFALVLDENPAVMSRERGHDVLPFQFSADEVFGPVELDAAMGVDFSYPRDQTLRQGQRQSALGVEIGIESKSGGQMTERRPESIPENAGKASAMLGQGEAPVRLPEEMIVQESGARPSEGAEIGAGVSKNAVLPKSIEALDGRVSTGLSRRNEEKMNAQEEMEADDLGEAAAIATSSRSGHLVVHLGDLRQTHKSPGIKEMEKEREGSFIPELMGRSGSADDIDGLDGIEPGDAVRPPQMTRADQVGLLEVAHFPGLNVGIGRSVGRAPDLGFFGLAGPGQDLLDGRNGGKTTDAPRMELIMDRLGPDPGEGRAAGLVGRQLVAESQDLADKRLSSLVPDMLRGPALVAEAFLAELAETTQPFGEPKIASLQTTQNLVEADPGTMKANRFDSKLIFVTIPHRFGLLPWVIGRSLFDRKNTYRCLYGFSHSDVLTETP